MIATQLYAFMEEQLRQAPTQFHRYAYPQIEWDGRLTGIVGPRGVSKNNVPDYLLYLEKAGMLGQLRDDTTGLIALGNVIPLWHFGMNY